MVMAVIGLMPDSMATRQALSMAPAVRASEGARSSVAKQQRRARAGFSKMRGARFSKSWLQVPSRIIMYMPRESFASASSGLVDSWSAMMPVAAYALRLRPPTRGAWPSSRPDSVQLAALIRASVSSSAPSTPGRFIISPSPNTSPGCSAMKARMSSAVMTAPACSSGRAGTQEGIMYLMLIGARLPSSIMKRRPSNPATLQISWLSAMAVVVPRVAAMRAYSAGRMLDDSMCRWPSMKPGER